MERTNFGAVSAGGDGNLVLILGKRAQHGRIHEEHAGVFHCGPDFFFHGGRGSADIHVELILCQHIFHLIADVHGKGGGNRRKHHVAALCHHFVELAKELHFTNTAQKLYISQQNLSQHVQKLEQYYGVVLFHRKPKLTLTYAGEQLLASATKILAEEKDLVNRLVNISSNRRGSLKVGIPAYRGQVCLPDILPAFYSK